jgi:hypothetical protein
MNMGLVVRDPEDRRTKLQNNLIEHFDYVTLVPSVWKHFYSWYSADIQIARKLKLDAQKEVFLDLYPHPKLSTSPDMREMRSRNKALSQFNFPTQQTPNKPKRNGFIDNLIGPAPQTSRNQLLRETGAFRSLF